LRCVDATQWARAARSGIAEHFCRVRATGRRSGAENILSSLAIGLKIFSLDAAFLTMRSF
jgi:hypothetical protein